MNAQHHSIVFVICLWLKDPCFTNSGALQLNTAYTCNCKNSKLIWKCVTVGKAWHINLCFNHMTHFLENIFVKRCRLNYYLQVISWLSHWIHVDTMAIWDLLLNLTLFCMMTTIYGNTHEWRFIITLQCICDSVQALGVCVCMCQSVIK